MIVLVLKFLPAFYQIDWLDPVQNFLQDLEITDIFFSSVRNHDEIPQDTNIVLVNVGFLKRQQIAKQIEIINQYNPKVIGIDVFFKKNYPDSIDVPLEEAFSKVKNLVLVSKIVGYNDSAGYYSNIEKSLPKFNKYAYSGFANFFIPILKEDTLSRTTRKFSPMERVVNIYEPSFPVKIATIFDSNKTKNLLKRNNETEIINFKRNLDKYKVLDIKDIFRKKDSLQFLKDKIVLMGFLGPDTATPYSMDIFFTPMNSQYIGKTHPDMYGVVVHANIISMILEQDFISAIPDDLSNLITIIIIYLTMAVFRYLRYRFEDLYETLGLFLLFGMLFSNFLITIYVLKWFNFSVEVKLMIFVIIIAEIVSESYHGSIKPLSKSGFLKLKKLFKF